MIRCVGQTALVLLEAILPELAFGNEAQRVMSEQRFRHLPIEENGKLCGLISMRDVTSWVLRSQQEQVNLAIGAVKRMGYANRRG